jgi:hypothetical protein
MSETDSVTDTPELTRDTDDPFEIRGDEYLLYALEPKQYESLKASIREHGVDTEQSSFVGAGDDAEDSSEIIRQETRR